MRSHTVGLCLENDRMRFEFMMLPLTLGEVNAWLLGVLTAFFIAVCVVMILTVLIQRPQGGGLSGAFGSGAGSGQTAFGARTGDALTIATISMFVVFVITAVGLNFAARPSAVNTNADEESPAETVPAESGSTDTGSTDDPEQEAAPVEAEGEPDASEGTDPAAEPGDAPSEESTDDGPTEADEPEPVTDSASEPPTQPADEG
ncbi:MAG: preprotein translocase subunit SecG [Planctomycetota bacterium]